MQPLSPYEDHPLGVSLIQPATNAPLTMPASVGSWTRPAVAAGRSSRPIYRSVGPGLPAVA